MPQKGLFSKVLSVLSSSSPEEEKIPKEFKF
jgi:hypothetical protein